uniref:Uncharacterized protein n=1 Tax=Meloidogyne enterolobii TaxID=390850 RepID=A0A6V7WK05_MELEN|nr:unnamed protein product [Meloidogyne enterolobii]
MLIGEIYSTIIYCFATFGLFSNLFLIWLILRYTMKEMQVYSKILLQTCFVDIVGICMFFVSQPVYVSDNGVGTIWNYGPIHFLPNPWQCILLRINHFMMRVIAMNVCLYIIHLSLFYCCSVKPYENFFKYISYVANLKLNLNTNYY